MRAIDERSAADPADEPGPATPAPLEAGGAR